MTLFDHRRIERTIRLAYEAVKRLRVSHPSREKLFMLWTDAKRELDGAKGKGKK